MTSIWLDSVSFKLEECIYTAKDVGLFRVLIILVSFLFFIDTKSILKECYLEMVTSWKVSPWARSLVSKVQENKKILFSLLDFQDHSCLTRVQPDKKLQFSPEKDISRKENNFWVIPGMENSFKKWFIFTDKINSEKKTMLCDNNTSHRKWLMETIMFYFMTLKNYSPFKDQKPFYQIPKLDSAIFHKYKESLLKKYEEMQFSKFYSIRNKKSGIACKPPNGICNHLNRIPEPSRSCVFSNSLGRCYNGLRKGKRNRILTSVPSPNATFPKLLTQYQGAIKGFLDTDLPSLKSLSEQHPQIGFKCPSSCDFLTSCLCQFAGHSSLTLILPLTKRIIYFDPCFHESKEYQKKIINHLLNTVCRHLQKPGDTWTVLSLKDPPKTFTREECDILVKAFAEQVLHRSKSFIISPNLLKENQAQMLNLSSLLGKPVLSWNMS